MHRRPWDDVARLMRVQDERRSSFELARTAFDLSDAGVPVFHRRGKVAALKRRAHPLVFDCGHAAAKHEALGAPADPAVSGPDDDVVFGWSRQRFGPDLAATRRGDPEGASELSRHGRSFCCFWRAGYNPRVP